METRTVAFFYFVTDTNAGGGLPSSFIYVACLPVGRYWLRGKTPGGRNLFFSYKELWKKDADTGKTITA
ncbi:MAG: hypothetical protein EPN92_05150 [Chitinophagaceae bacterium]|nr:MAG: hypothetical protein EPN92_05150 [Chitinophagaceae bacterium]